MMKKLFLLSMMGLLMAHVSVAFAAPRASDDVNEATEVIEVQEGLDESSSQNDVEVNEAEESPDAVEQEDAEVEADDQETEVESEDSDQQENDNHQDSHDQQDDSGHSDSGDSGDSESGD